MTDDVKLYTKFEPEVIPHSAAVVYFPLSSIHMTEIYSHSNGYFRPVSFAFGE